LRRIESVSPDFGNGSKEGIMAPKVWTITGASRGFGAEISKGVLAAGDKLVATARNTKGLEHLGAHDNIFSVALDVTNERQVNAGVDAALQHFGRIDVLVNNAGFGLLGAVEESSAEEVERVYRTNVFGLLNVTRAVLPSMRKHRSGHIINISSVGGYTAAPGFGVYCSTKFAVEGITEALYKELAPLGIHATVVEPGRFRTDFLDSSSLAATAARISDYADTVGKTREFAEEHNHQQPGDPAKLAQAILQLVNAAEPPLRLPLGTDTLQRMAEKNAFVEKETEKWRAVSVSTDFAVVSKAGSTA
jgi:NAD(P)-dependent dehydrogenase (short-subunit alcohol dehydrogenase family)